ncbi:ABC-F family ATP-binding cassette domain-containing protein [Porphyromonas endodontalis]|uniref:ABC-F family ATP-binding cassette domain-containing protein n=1 Tax=Porphyromonas endodontalis TaxID=28124 RepID=UPI0026EF64A4|nr:ABC-F family ATP-binding cassette domain-containing protein [Porphyromonas endodontalis]
MISVQHLTIDFGKQLLFNDVSFVVSPKERVALVGKNGAGKSTLLKLIAGLREATSGSVTHPKDLQIGYLPQVMQLADGRTVIEEVKTVFEDVARIKERVAQLADEMATRTDYDTPEYQDLIERFSHESDRLNLMGQDNYEAEAERTLVGLGFERTDFERPTSEFSGGWRMRIELAKILLRRPDILLLDEPTNHLDIESIEWLEQFIKTSGATLLLVSHDRAFLDATTTRTIEIELGRIYDYKANYSQYVTLRQERLEYQRRAYENQRKEIEDIEAFIERFRYQATKAIQVQSRIKQLEKIELIELDELDLSHIHFRFPPAERSGDFPIIVEDLGKAYGAHQVFDHATFTLRRGDKVAFVGKNGAGKSTMVKCIMQQINDYTGSLKIGHNIHIAYFSQNRAQELDPNLTIRDTVDRAARGPVRDKINNLLGAFMFGGELADKPVSVLSGGERARLAILILLLEPANLLILDEPTNHLDMRSKDVLKEAIKNFEGTVVLVSHDRDFLDGLVEQVYEFSHGEVIPHLGGIYDYLAKRRMESLHELETPKNTSKPTPSAPTKSSVKEDYQAQKERARQQRNLEKAAEEIEKKVASLEQELTRLEGELSAPNLPIDSPLYNEYDTTRKKLDKAMIEWERAMEKLS